MSDDLPASLAAPPPQPTEVEQRVREIATSMFNGTWLAGASHAMLADKWGVSPATVRNLASEANRLLRASLAGDLEEYRALMLAALDNVRLRARSRQRRHFLRYVEHDPRTGQRRDRYEPVDVPEPDFGAELASLKLRAECLGLVTHRLEVTTGPRTYEDWSDEELLAFAERGEVPFRFQPKPAHQLADAVTVEAEWEEVRADAGSNGRSNSSTG